MGVRFAAGLTGHVGGIPFSPLVGEMAGRPEGGTRNAINDEPDARPRDKLRHDGLSPFGIDQHIAFRRLV